MLFRWEGIFYLDKDLFKRYKKCIRCGSNIFLVLVFSNNFKGKFYIQANRAKKGSVYMDLKKAFELWVEITGVNPGETTIRLRDMDIYRANKVLSQSLKYDETYVTTAMLMKMYLDDFLAHRQISLKEITNEFELIMNWLGKINEFKSIINSEEVMEIKNDFKDLLKQALIHYGVDASVYESMMQREGNLAEIRYSAFNAINELEVVQFAHGASSKKKPRIYKDVFIFKDINTLIRWMMSVESGVVIAMIQDAEDVSNSYFVFAVRNGGTLSIVTDREKLSHPLRAERSRNRARGRAFYERITDYHFPYSVMKIDFGDNDRAYVSSEEKNELISKEEGIPIKAIKDLAHDEIAWLVMMFSLLEEKFFTNNYKTEELSYTAKMMTETTMLIETAKKHEIALTDYKPLEVPIITSESMKTENVMDNFEWKPTGEHDWMIERYSVPEEVFHVIGEREPVLSLPTQNLLSQSMDLSLRKMDLSSFGSSEKLKKDRVYLARYNQALVINVKAKEEFTNLKEEVQDWYIYAIRNNLPNLLKAVAERSFVVSENPDSATTKEGYGEKLMTNGNLLSVKTLKEESYYGGVFCHIHGDSTERYRSKYTCAVNDASASVVAHFYPRNASQLADLCGCEVQELHELLRGYKKERKRSGNSILNSVDPMDWAIKDPWEDLRMDVRIYLSKNEFNKLCKEYQTGNQSFWLVKKEV